MLSWKRYTCQALLVGPTFREYVKETAGKSMFPYMVDDNTGTAMYESDDIINYMYDKYGRPGYQSLVTST